MSSKGYWNAHSDRDWEDQLHEPPIDEGALADEIDAMGGETADNDPQPRAILDPSFDIFDALRDATHTAYPEARIPETPMYRPTYHAIKCPCGHPVCEAWMVEPVAAVQGVKFTGYQAERVAELLNHMNEIEREAAGLKPSMATESKSVSWTPGPWSLCAHLRTPPTDCRCGYKGGIWSEAADQIICEMGAHGQGSDMMPRPDEATQRANARLIAAAPTMADYIKRRSDLGDIDATEIWEQIVR